MPYRRIEDPSKLWRLLEAVLLLERDLTLPAILGHFVDGARSLTGARYGALGVLDDTRSSLVQFVPAGINDDVERAIGHRPTGLGILGVLITDPRPLRLENIAADPRSVGFPPGHPPMTSFLGVPVSTQHDTFGILYLTEKRGSGGFSQDDEWLAQAFAQAAAVAIENARLHERVQKVAVLEDRDRIARDLHDDVIQRLFATGLTLQSIAADPAGDVLARLDVAISEIDATIRRIRSAIFALADTGNDRGVRASILALVTELRAVLEFDPSVSFVGPVDTLVPTSMAEDLLAAVREGLTNVARHANASSASVVLEADTGTCTLTITDDGRGIRRVPVASDRTSDGGFGITNLRRRAEKLGGELLVQPNTRGGTTLIMRVPLAG